MGFGCTDSTRPECHDGTRFRPYLALRTTLDRRERVRNSGAHPLEHKGRQPGS